MGEAGVKGRPSAKLLVKLVDEKPSAE